MTSPQFQITLMQLYDVITVWKKDGTPHRHRALPNEPGLTMLKDNAWVTIIDQSNEYAYPLVDIESVSAQARQHPTLNPAVDLQR